MPNLSIKDVPDDWAEALRQRALRNHRSLQGELMALLERAVQDAPAPPLAYRSSTGSADGAGSRVAKPVMRRGGKSVEQAVAEMRGLYPAAATGAPLGVDILRAERDAR